MSGIAPVPQKKAAEKKTDFFSAVISFIRAFLPV